MKKLFTLLTMLVLGISGMWGQYLDRTGWSALASSACDDGSTGQVAAILDGSTTTWWHSNYGGSHSYGTSKGGCPHAFQLDLGSEKSFYGVQIQNRTDNPGNGRVKGYEIYVSNEPFTSSTTGFDASTVKSGKTPALTGTFSDSSKGAINLAIGTTLLTGRYVLFVITSSYNEDGNTEFAAIAEVNLLSVYVPSGYNSYTGENKAITSDLWKTQSNWVHKDNWDSDGPGCPNSNMWSPIYLKDITGGTVPTLEGWTLRMTADHSTYTIANVKKIQPEGYLTLKNTSVVTMNFGSGHTYSFTVNLDEGTGNTLNFKMSNGYNHFNAQTCSEECNGKITVNYGSVSKNTGRVFNASGSGAINNLVLNATLTEPTEKNTVESIPLATFTNTTVTTLTPTISSTAGWTLVDSKAALETQTTNGKYYYVEQNSTSGVTLHTYLRSIYEVSASTTETLSEITDYETYAQFNVPSGSTLNVDVPGFDPSVIESEGTVNYIVTQETEALSTITGYDTYDGIMVPSGKTLNVDVQNFDPSIIEGEGTVNYIVTGESETLSEITSYSTYDGIIVPEGQTLSVDKPEFDMSKITGEGTIIRVQKKVTFSIAVAVNGGDAVSTIYVACDGSDSFTLPANYKYTIDDVEKNGLQAATAIAAAGTSDISVTVSSPILANNQKYRIQQAWSAYRFYLYANTSISNRLWKNNNASTALLTNANYIWQAQSNDTNWKFYNNNAGRYIAKATQSSADGTSVNALSASNADGAETFTLVSAELCAATPNDYDTKCYVALKSNTKTTYLNSYNPNNNFVGWHNAVHAGYYFRFIPVKTVTFSSAVAVNGGDAVSTIYVACDGSDEFTLPTGYTYTFGGTTYYTAKSAAAAIAAAGTDDISVTVASVITDLSDLSNNKKYKIVCDRGGLSTYTSGENTYLASPVKTSLGVSAKDFAIISYGGRYYLYSVSDARFVSYYSETEAKLLDSPILLHGTADAIAINEISTGVFSIRFNNEASKIINSAGDDEYTYGIAINSYNTWDIGNQYVIVEVEDFDSSDALTALTTYMEEKTTQYNNIIATLENINWGSDVNKWKLNYYNFIGDFAGYAGGEASMIAGLKSEGYTSENLQTVQNMNVNGVSYALNMPTIGKFYRIKGNTSKKYLASGLTSSKFSMTNATDASTIFYYDGTKLTNLGSGMCNGMNKNNWSWVTGANASVVTFQDGLVLTDGGYAIKSADDAEGTNAAYLSDYGSSGYADRGSNMSITSSTDEVYTNWYLEEITDLPISNNNCYTSFSAPVAVTIPSGCKAYMATEKVGSVIRMTEIEGSYIAANTGIIIGTEDGSAINFTFPIYSGNELANTDGNILSANVVATAIAREGNYFFGKLKNSTDYVFTTLSGEGDNYTLPGFKAYLPTSTTGARLAIVWGDGDPTRLIELNNGSIELKDGKYYQNGKVIVVRNGIKYNVAGQIIK